MENVIGLIRHNTHENLCLQDAHDLLTYTEKHHDAGEQPVRVFAIHEPNEQEKHNTYPVQLHCVLAAVARQRCRPAPSLPHKVFLYRRSGVSPIQILSKSTHKAALGNQCTIIVTGQQCSSKRTVSPELLDVTVD